MKSPLLAILIALVVLGLAEPCLAQTDEERDWVDSHFWPMFEELMPIERDQLMNIGFRSHRDLYTNVLEYSFLLTYDYPNNTVTAVERVPDTTSIYDQLMKLHQKNPNDSVDNLKKLVRIRESQFTQGQCPAINRLLFQFNKIRFHGPPPFLIVLHPMNYEIKSNVGAGDMRLLFVQETQPLVRWAFRVKAALKTCAAQRNR